MMSNEFMFSDAGETMCDENDDDDDNPIHVEELALLSREELVARPIASEQRNRGTYYSTIDKCGGENTDRFGGRTRTCLIC
jgi:hypothetical protein